VLDLLEHGLHVRAQFRERCLRHNKLQWRMQARAGNRTSHRPFRADDRQTSALQLSNSFINRILYPPIVISVSVKVNGIILGILFPPHDKSISAMTINRPKRKSFSHTENAMMSAAAMMISSTTRSLPRYSNSGGLHVVSNFAHITLF